MRTMLDIHEYLRQRGATARLARELGITHAAVRQWMTSRVPAERVVDVERATGIDRERLRPDLYRRDPPIERAA
jgi:DNA-binding transcriptional regulator YdaS (Cro superfamily)